eukprot:763303-Hanusia_phi.AAC.17
MVSHRQSEARPRGGRLRRAGRSVTQCSRPVLPAHSTVSARPVTGRPGRRTLAGPGRPAARAGDD